MLSKLKLSEISPSNPPREASWQRVSNIETPNEVFEIIDTNNKFGLPKYLPREGNHRLAKLYQNFGHDYQVDIHLIKLYLESDLVNYQDGWHRCQTEGINNYSDFINAALSNHWERTK